MEKKGKNTGQHFSSPHRRFHVVIPSCASTKGDPATSSSHSSLSLMINKQQQW
jgi:hypothetical protein